MQKLESRNIRNLSLHRIENLFDLVIAISMTLLVRDLFVPAGGNIASDLTLLEQLKSMRLTFLNYAVSFFILSNFWILNNEQFNHIKKTDRPFLWLSLLGLFSLSLIPVTTSMKDYYAYIPLAEIVFHINKLLINLILFFRWLYMVKHDELIDLEKTKKQIVHRSYRESIPGFVTPIIAIGLSFIIPGTSSIVYFISPLIIWFYTRKKKVSSATDDL